MTKFSVAIVIVALGCLAFIFHKLAFFSAGEKIYIVEIARTGPSPYRVVLLNKTSHGADLQESGQHFVAKAMRNCPDCRVTKSAYLDELPLEYRGVFEGRHIRYNYLRATYPNGDSSAMIEFDQGINQSLDTCRGKIQSQPSSLPMSFSCVPAA